MESSAARNRPKPWLYANLPTNLGETRILDGRTVAVGGRIGNLIESEQAGPIELNLCISCGHLVVPQFALELALKWFAKKKSTL